MVFDRIDKIDTYRGIYGNLDKAIDYILRNDLSTLPQGRTEIFGEDLFVNIITGKLGNEVEGVYELHKKYLDLHLDLNGEEKILFTDKENSSVTHEYEEDEDYELMTGRKTCECYLDKKHFCICMTEEPHMPCVSPGTDEMVYKAIFKIKI